MAQDDFPPFRIPALGRWIARVFVTLGAGAKALRPRGLGRLYNRGVEIAQRHYLVPVYALALVLSPFWALLVFEVIVSLLDQLSLAPPQEADAKRAHFYAIGLTITGLGALLAAPFILIKAWVNERTARTAEHGHITDRITKAVEQLGAEKTVKVLEDGKTVDRTEPNLEVRLGAIYALERIAQDSERDHIPIMETLCAYVRENSNARAPIDIPNVYRSAKNILSTSVETARRSPIRLQVWAQNIPWPRTDVQAAVTVIGRRGAIRRARESEFGYRLDLQKANLQRVNLSGLSLDSVILSEARAEGANLVGMRLDGASLYEIRLDGAILWNTHLVRVFLDGASLEDAELNYAVIRDSTLRRAQMDGTSFTGASLDSVIATDASITGSTFISSKLININLQRSNICRTAFIRTDFVQVDISGLQMKATSFDQCVFSKVRARAADFCGAQDLNQTQLNAVFGDRSTKLPEGLLRTNLMDREPLEAVWDPDPDYEAWLAAGAPPGKPLT